MNAFFFSSPIGMLEIQTTNDEIVSVRFKDDNSATPAIHSKPLDDIQKTLTQQLSAYFSGSLKNFNLPLAARGTDFQERVWKELQNIPYGQTISYLTLAKRIGNIKTIRAVASANGKNPIAILIPCHRVVGSDGKLVGYSGGLHRKEFLLRLEQLHTKQVMF